MYEQKTNITVVYATGPAATSKVETTATAKCPAGDVALGGGGNDANGITSSRTVQ